MAEKDIQIGINADNNTQSAINSAKSSFAGFRKSLESLEPAFKKMSVGGSIAFAGISVGIMNVVKASNEAELAQTRLAQILKTSTFASDEQIAKLNEQAEALEKVGVVSADVIRQGQGQLASFDLQAESIEALIPSILNYAVAEKGLNMTSSDLQSVTNGLAQALQGNFGALTKTGFVLDEQTKAMISNGTETERVTALAQVLDSTYLGLNETMRSTTQGGIVGMQFAIDKLKESIGNSLKPAIGELLTRLEPLITKITDWIERNPELVSKIIIFSGVLAGLTAVVGGLALALIALTSPFTLVALAITGIIALITLIAFNFDKIKVKFNEFAESFKTRWTEIKNFIKGIVDAIIQFFQPLIDIVNSIVAGIERAVSFVGDKLGIGGGKKKKVNDAVITPRGDVIETHPNDYLIATKNPFSIGANNGGPNITINNPLLLDNSSVQLLAQKLGNALRMEVRI